MSKCKIIDLPNILDSRGNLTVANFGADIPFDVKRFFMVYQVPLIETRGEHAHRKCHQFLVAARGRISVTADDGYTRQDLVLDRPDLGLYLPPMVWGVQHGYSPDACLLVFASEYYDKEDYIRDYDEFLRLVRGAP